MNATEWADRINGTWRKSVEAIIETGRVLIQAKEELGHGNWRPMFSSRGFNGPVPFTVRTAQQLMEIARNEILSNANFESHLPPHWTTLYQLATLPDNELLAQIEDGTIHPGMTRDEAARLPGPKIDQFLKGLDVLMHFYRRYQGRPDVLARMIRYAPEVNRLMYSPRELREELPDYMRQMLEELEKLYDEDRQG